MPNIIKGRFVQKHDTEANWALAINFSPLQGEIIVYDPDDTYSYARFKVGDGATNVNDLPFTSGVINLVGTTENPVDIDQIKSFGTYLISGEVTTSMDITSDAAQAKLNKLFIEDLASGQFMSVYSLQEGFINQCVMSPVTPLVRLDSGAGYCDPFDVSKIQPVEKTSEMTQPVGMRRDGQLFTKPFVQAQSDWNQNDSTAPDYVKNRTHWEESTPTTFIDNEILAFKNQLDSIYVNVYETVYKFTTDKIFNVIWDGMSYECICFKYQDFLVIGNPNIIGAQDYSSAEPFLMRSSSGKIFIYTNSTSENHTISLFGDIVVAHTIDKKYLPPLVGQAGTGLGAEVFNDYTGKNIASGEQSHAEGYCSEALGNRSHAEGWANRASGHNSHAEGYMTESYGANSHAEGIGIISKGANQHAQGAYNVIDEQSRYAHIVGNGTNFSKRSNAHTLDWSGNAWFAGNVKVGGTGQDDAAAKTLATTDAIPTKISDLTNDSGFLTSHQDISGKLDTTGDGSNVTAAFTAASNRANISTGEKLSVIFGKIAKWFADLGSLAFKSTVAKSDLASDVQTSLGKADTALQSYTETDPTVHDWAKAETKPTYTAAEVGAVPTSRTVNSKALSANITLSASDVGALPSSAEVVKYTAQTLTTAQKTQARTNIGAGTSSFSGSYNDLTNKPTIPSAYTLPAATASALGGVKSGGDISVASDGTVTVTKESLPAYTSADEGKVLRIVNGTPTWVTLTLTMDANGVVSF